MAAESSHDEDCPQAGLADIADVFADDELIELLRTGRYGTDVLIGADVAVPGVERPTESTSDELVALLSEWRSDVLTAPIPAVEPSVVKIEPVLAEATLVRPRSHRHRHSMRSAFAVVVAFVGLLLGSTVVSAREAQPGDLLFGVTSLIWPQEAAETVARLDFLGSVRLARSALDAGSIAEAEVALARAEQALGSAGTADQASLKAQLDDVRSQLVHPAVVIHAGDDGQLDSSLPMTSGIEIPVVAVSASSKAKTVQPSAEPEPAADAASTVAEQSPAPDATASSVVESTAPASTESTTVGTETTDSGATTAESSAPSTLTSEPTTAPSTTVGSSTGAGSSTSAVTSTASGSSSGTAATTARTTTATTPG